ncbi:CynX/NimT family MFS transporter [Promicromonospora iranensis]|uniref:CP family cyanate transporter-like MFS transporter n=1 Tax=Promicromonospora iranensis TaxID=1105144 RepID=A0ABU2CRH6_9MICO|nr:MFS transporter [Promicromonospora iranensis]MDR7383944.1 CP family cyanate transporter-like MFS transporter [Promicromonospora iranensis]
MSNIRTAAGGSALLVAVLVFALNLRTPITSLPPVMADVATGLGLDQTLAGLLVGIPALCFSVVAPAASALIARVGPYSAVTVALVGVIVGTLVRSAGTGTAGVVAAFTGTVVLGCAITVGNVVVPVIIARDFPTRTALATGLYSSTMNLGSVFATSLTAPFAALMGWQGAIASWSVVAMVALVVWLVTTRRLSRRTPDGGGHAGTPTGTPVQTQVDGPTGVPADAPAGPVPAPRTERPDETWGGVLRRPITWALTVAFAGQSFSYFAVTGWLPELLRELLDVSVTTAGNAAAPFQGLAIAGSVLVPLALAARVPMRGAAVTMGLLWASLPAGLLLMPQWWLLWVSLAGIAQGGNFVVIFTIVAQRCRTVAQTRRTVAAVQAFGYAVAATAPAVIGAVHAASGGWTAALLVLLGSTLALGTAELLATRRPKDMRP